VLPAKKTDKPIVAADFGRRLVIACDNSDRVPEHNFGRQTYIATELDKRFGVKVSRETVRKWFAGEVRPRPDKMKALAHLLKVDEAWLALGMKQAAQLSEGRRLRSSITDGVVHLVIGIFTLNGASCAFPEQHDPRAKSLHFYAIIAGRLSGVYVSLGEKVRSGFKFTIPEDCEHTLVIGVIKRAPMEFDLYHLKPSTVLESGVKRGGWIELTGVDRERAIQIKAEILPRIETFDSFR
jgi:transcriptional regulator with XRE-family HTH domain